MKPKILPLALVATGLFTNTAAAGDTGPKFYGKVNVSFQNNDFEEASTGIVTQDKDNWTLNSNLSRLGVKGSVPINDNLKAIYKAEYEISVDGDKDEFSQRNIYGGLQGSWGTLIAGKHDTPLKMTQGKLDRFNDLEHGDIKHIMVGENREGNIIIYTTPKFNHFALTAAIIPGEESEGEDNDDFADRMSLALTYKLDDIYLAIGVDENVQDTDVIRVVGNYKFADAQLGVIYQTADGNDSSDNIGRLRSPLSDFANNFDEQDAYLISGQWQVSEQVVLKTQLAKSKSTPSVASNLDDTDATQIAFGADYKLSKASKLFAYYARIKAQADTALANDDILNATFGVGFEVKF